MKNKSMILIIISSLFMCPNMYLINKQNNINEQKQKEVNDSFDKKKLQEQKPQERYESFEIHLPLNKNHEK